MCLSGSLTFEGETFSLKAIAADDEAVESESAKKISTPSTLAQDAWNDEADDISDNGHVEEDNMFSQQVGFLDEELLASLEEEFEVGSPNKHK